MNSLKDLRKELAIALFGSEYLDPKKWKKYCFVWNSLTEEEKKRVRKDVLYLNSTAIDLAHIFSRSTHPDLKFSMENVVFIARGFHSFLTNKKSFFKGEENIFLAPNEVYLFYLRANSLKEYKLRRHLWTKIK